MGLYSWRLSRRVAGQGVPGRQSHRYKQLLHSNANIGSPAI